MASRAAVKVVAGEPAGELARRVQAELGRGGHAATLVVPAALTTDGVLVFVDDPALPAGLARLIQLAPGRATYANALLVVGDAGRAGGLLGEGFRDVVGVADAAAAVDALVRGRAPILFTKLRQEIEGDFLPKFVAEMRQRAREKQTLVNECVELMRATAHVEKRIYRLRKIYFKQGLDELLVQDGRIDAYLRSLDERRSHRLARLPSFPSGSPLGGVLGKREPRTRRSREEIDDTIDWLRQAGFLRVLGKQGLEALTETATTLATKPVQGLRDCLNIIEREIALRLALVDRIEAQVDPIAVLEERCLERHSFAILPPGIALPDGVHLVIRSAVQPPSEVYASWCLDLRDLKVKQCAEVMEDIARDLAWTRERPPTAAPARESLEQNTVPAQRM